MVKAQHLFLVMGVFGAINAAQSEPKKKTYMVEDFRMGNSLFLQSQNAKKGVDINTDLAKPAKRLNTPNSKNKDEVKVKKMIVLGFPGTYSLGYYVFYDEQHSEQFFPHQQKSIYSMCDVYDETKPTMHIGSSLMLAGFEPVGIVNSPWQKVADYTTRSSTVIQVPLKLGLNFLNFQLDPQNKIYEAERTANIGPGGDSAPWIKLEENNKASFVVELVKPPIIIIPKQK